MKLMGNLLGKPGRSFHELSNGIKQALGAYKNYSKEWDSLNQGGGFNRPQERFTGNEQPSKKSNIDTILQNVKKNRPAPQPQMSPAVMPGGFSNQVPPTPQPTPPPSNGVPPMDKIPNLPEIAGQPQQSSFNRPAPVNQLGIYGH
jgi:hypothetical protein